MKGKLLMLVLGFVLGGAATMLLPRFVGPLLPAGLMSGGEAVEGIVVKRQRDGDRLLLTINTPQGAALATFTDKVAEIDLLVEEGDTVTLALGEYEPFVDNPSIRAVKKAEAADPTPEPAAPAPEPATGLPPSGMDEPPSGEADGEPAEAPGAEAELEEWPAEAEDG